MNTPNTTASAHTRGWFLTPATEQNAFLIVTGRGATGNAKTGKKRFLLERMHLGDEPVRRLKRILASEYQKVNGKSPSREWLYQTMRAVIDYAGEQLTRADHVEVEPEGGTTSMHFVSRLDILASLR